MIDISRAIVILILVGGVLGYLLVDKFAPDHQPCETFSAGNNRDPVIEDNNPGQGRVDSRIINQTPVSDYQQISVEEERLRNWENDLNQKQRQLDILEEDLKRKSAQQQTTQEEIDNDQQELANQTAQVESFTQQLEAKSLDLEHKEDQIRESEQQLQRMQIGTFILADLILITALVIFGLPLLRRWRSRQVQMV